MTFYRLPLVTIGLSLTVITVLLLVTDIQMELVWQKAALCTKSVSAVKNFTANPVTEFRAVAVSSDAVLRIQLITGLKFNVALPK